MFGFLKQNMVKEHLKLILQNGYALEYIDAFYNDESTAEYKTQVEAISESFMPGNLLNDIDTQKMLEINKALRALYSNSSGPRTMKPFDKEFQPQLGWKQIYKHYNL